MNAEPPLPPALLMSVSCLSDYDLLCGEDTSGVLSGESPECSSSDIGSSPLPPSPPPSPTMTEDCYSIASFIEHERNFVPGFEYLSRFQSRSLDANAREESVAWILKETNGWPLQLLSVACLSLAAKMEEPLVPSLLDLQIEGAKYIFEPRTIRRMELLVLGVLDWRLRSVTPLCFLVFFACKADSTGTFTRFLISRATEIIVSNIQEASFLAYRPSCIAAAAILTAANEIPNWSVVKPEQAESWCQGIRKEKVIGCYQLMQELVINNNQRKLPTKVLPQLRVTTRTRMRSSTVSSFSSTSSSSSSTSFSLSCKRRKLNNRLWVDDEKGNSE
ncbi:hypothetical protein GLYMA_08G291000v4 [Glycine max]|nr:hypothetical protein GLYMA_08G291000v4 [Glycine max]KAH1053654.1 hypothetical protein GYH30_022763 [Glycine max]